MTRKYTDWGHLAGQGATHGQILRPPAGLLRPPAGPGRLVGSIQCRKCGRLSVRLVTVGLMGRWRVICIANFFSRYFPRISRF